MNHNVGEDAELIVDFPQENCTFFIHLHKFAAKFSRQTDKVHFREGTYSAEESSQKSQPSIFNTSRVNLIFLIWAVWRKHKVNYKVASLIQNYLKNLILFLGG